MIVPNRTHKNKVTQIKKITLNDYIRHQLIQLGVKMTGEGCKFNLKSK